MRSQSNTRTVPSRPRVRSTVAVAREVNRTILALYDGAEEKSTEQTRLHRLLEMPLNHLGYRLAYWDLRQGLPTVAEARRYHAVATWFDEQIPEPRAYLSWAAAVAKARVRFIVMDFIGASLDDEMLPAVNGLLAHIGLEVKPIWVPPSEALRVAMQSDVSMGFERPLVAPLPGFMVYHLQRATVRSHVVVTGPADGQEHTSHPVVTSSGGGFAAYGFAANYDQTSERMGWVLNPFEFLQAALGEDVAPVPDTTTLVGHRLYFSHIDGDGWNNLSQIERPGRTPSLVSEVVLEELIKPFPDLPVTVGIVAGDFDPTVAGRPRAARTARELFALPQVEVASHSYTHPYDWGAFATRESQQKAARLAAANPLRAYAQREFDLDREITGSLEIARSLAPASKAPQVFLWSGNTQPFPEAIRATRGYGVRNLNGGDGRLDRHYPSHAYLAPLARQVGGERQIYSGNANETIYTQGWTAPYDRFLMLSETLARTETPRRLKPFNVYYHMYSGERPESLAAVKHHLDAARASALVPISASHYAAIADSFFEVTITALGPSVWRIANRGALHTMRFDNAEAITLDYARTSGVLGQTRHAGALFVALDPVVREAELAIQRLPFGIVAEPGRPVLVGSRWPLSGLQLRACGFEVDAQGFGPGQMTWTGLRPGPYAITTWQGSNELDTTTASADTTGSLVVTLTANAMAGVKIVVECRP